jgi:mycofactocin precursor
LALGADNVTAVTDPRRSVPVIDPTVTAPAADATAEESTLVEAELLVEDVSIDGMCGVY